MTHNTLHRSTHQTHEVLSARLDEARGAHPTRDRPRDRYPAVDTFLASTSRHVAAAVEVLPRAVSRRTSNQRESIDAFRTAAQRLEVALARTKAKLYGEAHAVHLSWSEVWASTHERFADYWREEDRLIKVLVDLVDDESDDKLALALYRAELAAPTRPHPWVPHRGVPGRVARRICVRVDRFWDATEGRMVPEPPHPHDRNADGRFTQYFLSDPHLPD